MEIYIQQYESRDPLLPHTLWHCAAVLVAEGMIYPLEEMPRMKDKKGGEA